MRQSLRNIFLLISISIFFCGCGPEVVDPLIPNKDYNVLIYSRTTCTLCQNFEADIAATSIKHSVYDIDNDSAKEYEMQLYAYEYDLIIGGMTINLPLVVLIVDSTDVCAWSCPSLSEVEAKVIEIAGGI